MDYMGAITIFVHELYVVRILEPANGIVCVTAKGGQSIKM